MATTFVATPQPGNNPPRTLLELEYTGQTSAVITRTDPDGRERPVRLGEPAALLAGIWTGYDYESWFEQPATYTATTAGGSLTAGPVTLDVDVAWLRHPGVPSLSQPVDFQGEGQPVRPVAQAVLEPIGRRTPIVVTDGRRKSKRGTITLRTQTSEQADALLDLVDDTSVLLLDIPPSFGYNMDPHQYVSLGDLAEDRQRPDFYLWPRKQWTAPYIVVDRPAGGLQAEWTYDGVLATWATYNDVKNNYDTYTDLTAGTTN